MDSLEQKQKEELIKNVEFILSPVNGKFVSFEDSIEMYAAVRSLGDHRDIISEENKITIYHMRVKINSGEFILSFMSNELEDSRWAVVEACAHSFSGKSIIPEKSWQEINRRIFDLYKENI